MSAINVNAMSNFIFKVELTRRLPQSGENQVALSGVRRVFENEAARCVSVSVPCSKHITELDTSTGFPIISPRDGLGLQVFPDGRFFRNRGGFESHLLLAELQKS